MVRWSLRIVWMVLVVGGGLAALPGHAWGSPGDGACDCAPHPCCGPRASKEPACPPAYQNLRFEEDWTPCVCVPCEARRDWADQLKARRICARPFVHASVGGQVRARFESFSQIGFGAPADAHDAWLLLRARTHLDLHVGKHLRVFAEGLHASQIEHRELGPRPIDRNQADLLNAFVEVHAGDEAWGGALWAGRRELSLGKQRLVSPLDWANTRRTFQGVGGWLRWGPWKAQGWFTNPVAIERGAFDDDGDEDRRFFGAALTNTALDCLTWEVAFLGLHEDLPGDDRRRHTVVLRADGVIPGTRFDHDLEAAYQWGDDTGGDVSAWMVSATLGYAICAPCGKPRMAIGFDHASGDDDPGDGDDGTFHQLFPLAHKYLGHADVIGRRNVTAFRLEGSVQPTDALKLEGWFHLFRRAEEDDAVYAVTGGVLRAPGGADEKAIATELDLRATWSFDHHWKAFVEYTRVFAGAFLRNTGAAEDMDVWYLGIQGTF